MSTGMISNRILPVSGTEKQRTFLQALGADDPLLVDELHTTNDQGRAFIKHLLISGGKYLGTVTNEAHRFSFNTDFPHVGCWPGDVIQQYNGVTGSTGSTGAVPAFFMCLTNHGETDADWAAFGGNSTPAPGEPGENGWSPELAVVADGARRVLELVGWTGGTGDEPPSGLYIGAAGFVVSIADGVDIRGAAGGAGAAANIWRTGAGVPADGLGTDLDFYLQTTTTGGQLAGSIYQRTSGHWNTPIFVITTTMPQASASVLGAVKVGYGLAIDAVTGILSVALSVLGITWFGWDSFESYVDGALPAPSSNFGWPSPGAGESSLITSEGIDNFDGYADGALPAPNGGTGGSHSVAVGWNANGDASLYAPVGWDSFDSYADGTLNTPNAGTGWAANGSTAIVV